MNKLTPEDLRIIIKIIDGYKVGMAVACHDYNTLSKLRNKIAAMLGDIDDAL